MNSALALSFYTFFARMSDALVFMLGYSTVHISCLTIIIYHYHYYDIIIIQSHCYALILLHIFSTHCRGLQEYMQGLMEGGGLSVSLVYSLLNLCTLCGIFQLQTNSS